MSKSKIEQDEIVDGYTYVETTCALLGTGTLKKVAIKGGNHPKMRLLVADISTLLNEGEGFSEDWSFVTVLAAATSGAVQVSHKDGVVAGRTGALNLANEISPFAPVATSDETIFEANEDVIIEPSTTLGGATGAVLAVLKFEVVN